MMTDKQRDYIGDLAAEKGVRLDDGTFHKSAEWASAKIDELKSLPSANDKPIPRWYGIKAEKLYWTSVRDIRKWGYEGDDVDE